MPSPADAATTIRPTNSVGLVTWWKFEDGSGTTVADASGAGNSGTITGSPTWVSGRTGQALQFSSSGQYVSRTVSASATVYTVSAWIQYNGSVPISSIKVAFSYGSGSSGTIWMGYASNGRLAVSNSSVDLTSSTVVNDTNWHHVAVVVSGGTMTGYADGALLGSQSIVSRPGNTLKVGDYTSSGFAFTGKVDDVRVYNRALTAAEISTLYGTQTTKVASGASLAIVSPLSVGLAGYWSFDGADVTDRIYDRVGGNSAYYYGGATSSAKVAGSKGQALKFNGNSQYVVAGGTYPTGTSPRTLCAWVKSDDTTFEGNADHVINYGTANTNQSFGFMIHTGNQWRFFGFGGSVDFDTGVSVDTNWHYHCLTYDGTTVIYYYDAANVASQPRTLATTGGSMTFGTRQDLGAANEFNGKIDEVRLYTRALSASEISQLYRMGSVRPNASSATFQQGGTLGSGLVGHWTFDGQDFTTTVSDKSGGGNGGYVFGVATSSVKVAGKLGQGFKLSGVTGQYVSVPYAATLAPTGAISFGGWFKTTDKSVTQKILSKTQSGGYSLSFNPDALTNVLAGYVQVNGSYVIPQYSSDNIQNNTWYHAFVTYDGAAVRLYVNGVLVDSVAATGSITYSATNALCLGYEPGTSTCSAGDGFRGSLDDLRVYARGLSAGEVRQLYLMGK